MPENLEEIYTDEEDAGLACKDHHGCWKIEGHYSPLQDSDDFGCRKKEINCYQCTSKVTQVLFIYLILFHQKSTSTFTYSSLGRIVKKKCQIQFQVSKIMYKKHSV